MSPIKISEEAKKEIISIMENKGIPSNYFLRIKAGGAGCSGTNLTLGFDEENDEDQSFEIDGLKVLVEKKQFMYIIGQEIGFMDNDNARGFYFKQSDE